MGTRHASRLAGPVRRLRTGLRPQGKAPVTIMVAGALL